jgi:GT2 family glycosyltransferase
LQPPRVTVAIPTLSAGQPLWDCLHSLNRQSCPDFHIVIIDNSGARLVESTLPPALNTSRVSILHPASNIGFGAAANLAARHSPTPFLAVLNDDALPEPTWLAALLDALDRHPRAGSAASQVLLHEDPSLLDSAGMSIALDGTSKQRGHRQPASHFSSEQETLLPSGSAALFRARMLADTGGFDASFFLYCEDTDLGLRARWAGWTSIYVPSARVLHHYSLSAGRASRLKAFYVERNRLLTLVKNYPLPDLLLALLSTPLRYLHHLLAMRRGHGAAAHFQRSGGSPWTLVACVLRAHLSALAALPLAWRQRRAIRRSARISPADFRAAIRRFSISLAEVAAQ